MWSVVCTLMGGFCIWVRCGALPPGLLEASDRQSVVVTDRQGRLLYEALSARELRSRWLQDDQLPPHLVNATIAAEDSRFFRHPGVDPLALFRAMWSNLRAGRIVSGGSTITQQVVKQLTGRKRTIAGKLWEIVLALRLEHRLTKRQILALYLNLAPYGNQYAGVDAAARGYFGTAPAGLTPAQAALLAALPQRPSVLDPHRNLAEAVGRQRWVLDRMRVLGSLEDDAYDAARHERVALKSAPGRFEAPHFVQMLLASSERGPCRFQTTLDLNLQHEVQGVIAAKRRYLSSKGAYNVAVVVIENATGEVLAWEGSGDYSDAGHSGAIDGVLTPRQPGSALKPFTYAAAFELGMTPASVLADIPSHFATAEDGVSYSPRNYDGIFRGPMRARVALAGSQNVPAVRTLAYAGVPRTLELLRRAGVSTLVKSADYYGYGLTLGDAEVPLLELTAAYSALARGGLYVRPHWLTIAEDGRASARRLVSSRTAFWITDILADARARAYAFGRGGSLEFPFAVAVKTGTSQGYTDNWTIGYTREVTVGVWVGNFDRRPLRTTSGVMGAGPIFRDVLMAAQLKVTGRLPTDADPPIVDPPGDLRIVPICALAGMKPGVSCPSVTREWLPSDRLPPVCTWHVQSDEGSETVWPVELAAWAAERASDRPVAIRTAAVRTSPSAASDLVIENPPDGAIYLIDPTLRTEYQSLDLRARGRAGVITWKIDGRPFAQVPRDQTVLWPLIRGAHTIEASDSDGGSAIAGIRVK